uniref:NADH dehydrogenase [ubiquinone] 1 alpha subcomplex subunit 2 n=1 Tax=Timema genevievae TaxID=629358 RepID=A0A7R9K7R7_TIMGE|nr:unnamed protein product [Timema genevievae]
MYESRLWHYRQHVVKDYSYLTKLEVEPASVAAYSNTVLSCLTRPPKMGRFGDFIEQYYVNLKKSNPKFPILIRECSGVQPRVYARYESLMGAWKPPANNDTTDTGGVIVGFINDTTDTSGLIVGFINDTTDTGGLIVGFINDTTDTSGVIVGFINDTTDTKLGKESSVPLSNLKAEDVLQKVELLAK